MAYRFRIMGGRPTGVGDILLDVEIETDQYGDWVIIPNGQCKVRLGGDAVLAITEAKELTDPQKRTALLALFKIAVQAAGIDLSVTAYDRLCVLLPNGWPVTVAL